MVENILESKRLQLNVLDYKSAAQVLYYYNRNQAHFKQAMPLIGAKFLTIDYQEILLRYQSKEYHEKRMLKLWLFEKHDAALQKIVGDISFSNIVWGSFLSCHLGYKLDKDEVKKGYMREALRISIAYIFRQLKLHRIEANIMPINTASIQLIEHLGFKKEGLSTDYLKINGQWENHIRYALLNTEM